jgi:hypothetical protein
MLFQVMSVYITKNHCAKSGKVIMCHVKLGQVWPGEDRLSELFWLRQVSSGYEWLSQIISFYFRLCQIMTCNDLFVYYGPGKAMLFQVRSC